MLIRCFLHGFQEQILVSYHLSQKIQHLRRRMCGTSKKRMSFKSKRDLNMSPNNNLTRMLHGTGTFTYMDGLNFVGSMWVTDFPPHHIPPEKSSTFTKIRFLPLEAPFQIPRQLLQIYSKKLGQRFRGAPRRNMLDFFGECLFF